MKIAAYVALIIAISLFSYQVQAQISGLPGPPDTGVNTQTGQPAGNPPPQPPVPVAPGQ